MTTRATPTQTLPLDDDNVVAALRAIPVTLFTHDKVDHASTARVVASDLYEVITTDFPTDAHLATYTSSDGRRLIKTECQVAGCQIHSADSLTDAHVPTTALVLIHEVDKKKGASLPPGTPVYDKVLAALEAKKDEIPPPNVVTETKSHAARLYYVLDGAVEDKDVYECKWRGMYEDLAQVLDPTLSATAYVDWKPRDWPRLWRCPRVTLDDGTTTFDRRVAILHLDPLPWASVRTSQGRGQFKAPDAPASSADDRLDDARRYLAETPGAVSGDNGHDKTFAVACKLARDFHLWKDDMLVLMKEWNTKCEPPWEDRDLTHKVRDALVLHPPKPRIRLLKPSEYTFKPTTILPTPWPFLNDLVGGFRTGESCGFLAGTYGGKTTYAVEIAAAYLRMGYDVCHIDIEGFPEDFFIAVLQALTHSGDHAEVTGAAANRLVQAWLERHGRSLRSICRPRAGLTADDVIRMVEEADAAAGRHHTILVIDYLDRLRDLSMEKKLGTKYDAQAHALDTLMHWAHETERVIFTFDQIQREGERRAVQGKKVNLDSIAGAYDKARLYQNAFFIDLGVGLRILKWRRGDRETMLNMVIPYEYRPAKAEGSERGFVVPVDPAKERAPAPNWIDGKKLLLSALRGDEEVKNLRLVRNSPAAKRFPGHLGIMEKDLLAFLESLGRPRVLYEDAIRDLQADGLLAHADEEKISFVGMTRKWVVFRSVDPVDAEDEHADAAVDGSSATAPTPTPQDDDGLVADDLLPSLSEGEE